MHQINTKYLFNVIQHSVEGKGVSSTLHMLKKGAKVKENEVKRHVGLTGLLMTSWWLNQTN